jgi:cyclic pyranopterin phosphate synthase
MNLSHFNDEGRARMVDISGKADSIRTAVARTTVSMQPTTLQAIHQREIAKGDVLAVAQVAGIMAAKRTAELIPMCHPIQLKGVDLHFSHDGHSNLNIEATVRTTGSTGVEMEALTAVSVAALTVYDMCKSIDQAMHIGPTQLQLKTGGKNGDFIREN